MSGRVIVVGSVNIDLVARVPALPHPGETVMGGTYERHNGGKGGNQAVAAARLGRPTLFIGAVGADSFQLEARRALAAERVDVSMVSSLPGQATGIALILVDAAGENQIAVVPGANDAIEPGYARDCLSRLGRLAGDVVLVCNEVPGHVVREALMYAQSAGAITILNPAPATGIDRATFSLADIVAPNRTELEILLAAESGKGRKTPAGSDIAARARALLAPGPGGDGGRKAVIVTLGAAGVVVLQRAGATFENASAPRPEAEPSAAVGPEGAATAATAAEPAAAADGISAGATRSGDLVTWEVSAARVATIDTTGAGDAFCGALAAALAEGRSLAEAVERAVAGGALATTHVGAREGMPTAAELDEFMTRGSTAQA
jgi:ribokinase